MGVRVSVAARQMRHRLSGHRAKEYWRESQPLAQPVGLGLGLRRVALSAELREQDTATTRTQDHLSIPIHRQAKSAAYTGDIRS